MNSLKRKKTWIEQELETEKKKEDSQDELKQKELELADAKKLFNNLVNSLAKTSEEKEYTKR